MFHHIINYERVLITFISTIRVALQKSTKNTVNCKSV